MRYLYHHLREQHAKCFERRRTKKQSKCLEKSIEDIGEFGAIVLVAPWKDLGGMRRRRDLGEGQRCRILWA